MGQTIGTIQCNSSGSCTCALPIESPDPATLAHLHVARSTDHARSLLRNRPTVTSCLLVTSRDAAHLRPLLSSSVLLYTFESDSAIGLAVNDGRPKPSKVLAFRVPPDHRETASCNFALANAELPDSKLKSIYRGSIQSRAIKVLFDSGASSCFIGLHLVQKLGLVVRPSCLKSVATAAGRHVPILGQVSFELKLGPTEVRVTSHVLPELLSQVQLIIGEDFMEANHVELRYNPVQCVLHAQTQNEVILEKSHPSQSRSWKEPELTVEPGPPELPGQISPAVAARLLKRPDVAAKAFVVLITPLEELPKPILATATATESPPAPDQEASAPKPNLDHIPPDIRAQLESLLDEFQDIFSEAPRAGGALVDLPQDTIKLIPGAKPPFRKNLRLSPLELQELRTQVTELLKTGCIIPSNSPFASPVLFVPKANGKGLRFTLDYRAVNALTIPNRFQLPRVDDLLDAARGATCFTSLDMASSYWQIPLPEEEQDATSFTCPLGSFKWTCLAQGLRNSPSSFMRTMTKVFEKYLGDFLLLYMDDALILSKTPEEHLVHLRKVFEIMRERRFAIKGSKCRYLQDQIKYLGHILTKDGVMADPSKIKTVQEWQFPENANGMLQFLGLVNYFRRFIPNHSRITSPLYHLTKKSVPYQKGEEAQLAFEAIKQLLVSPPVLAYPDPDKAYELISDASITGCGAILVQEGRPVAYFSSRFSQAERNYTTGEQEMLGIIKALKEWRCYLEGCNGLTLVTDHNPLTFFSVQPTLSRRQARWSEFLSRFQFEFKYRPGATNPADSLSRLYGSEPCVAIMCLAVTVSEFSSDLLARIKSESATDTHLQSREHRTYEKHAGYWTYQGRIVVPASMQLEIVREHHSNVVSGHFSWSKTLDLVSRQFWWPKMRETVQTFVQSCASCQHNKASNQRPYGLLHPLEIPDTRWHTITMDFVTDLPKTPAGHTAILVFVDKLTKYVHLVPTTMSCTAEEVSRLFLAHVFQYHGMPKVLISDRDPRFTSAFWRAFCKRLHIHPRYSTAFHPQTDGQTERTNRVLEEVLRHFLDGDHASWEELLPLISFAINNAKSSSTGETPFFLNHGTHPETPMSLGIPVQGPLPALEQVFRDLESTLTRIKGLLQSAQDRQKAYVDARFRRAHSFQEGDQVLLSTKNLKFQTGKKKFHPKYIGPFTIQDMIGENAAHLKLPPSYKIHPVFHVSLLKPYHEGSSSKPLSPELSIEDGLPYYQVEHILATRVRRVGRKKVQEFLIKWLGYDDSHNSWEPRANLTPDLLEHYPAP